MALMVGTIAPPQDACAQAPWTGTLGLVGVFPTAQLGSGLGADGVGLTAQFRTGSPGGSAVSFGGSISWALYSAYRDVYLLQGTGGDYRAELSTSHALVMAYAFVRYDPLRGRLRPWVEAFAGLTHFYTRSAMTTFRTDVYDPIARSFLIDDTVLSYGPGVGLSFYFRPPGTPQIRETEQPAEGEGAIYNREKGPLSLDVSLRFVRGPSATFVRRRSILLEGDDYLYEAGRAPLRYLQLNAAMVWAF